MSVHVLMLFAVFLLPLVVNKDLYIGVLDRLDRGSKFFFYDGMCQSVTGLGQRTWIHGHGQL